MLQRLLLACTLGIALVAFANAPARAASDGEATVAREHYQKGLRLYELLRYKEAATEFAAAYEAKPDPAFLYNVAQAYRLDGQKEPAIGAYRSYLERAPTAANRAEVEARIAELQAALEAERRAQPSTSASESGSRPGFGLKLAGGVLAGVGIAAIATGLVFGLDANATQDRQGQAGAGQMIDPSVADNLKLDRTLSIAMITGGGAAAVGGAVLMVLGFRQSQHPRISLLPLLGHDRAGASLHFEF